MLLANGVVGGFEVETLTDVVEDSVEILGAKGVVFRTTGILREVVSTTALGRQV